MDEGKGRVADVWWIKAAVTMEALGPVWLPALRPDGKGSDRS